MATPAETNCANCERDYALLRGNATAYLFLTDPRCNHACSECPHCGASERIYYQPTLMVAAIDGGGLRVSVYAEASQELRVSAEQAWLRSEQEPAEEEEPEGVVVAPQERALTADDEQVVEAFAKTLGTIPAALLWDGFGSTPTD